MALSDSLEKIVTSYFAKLTAESFTYKDVTYEPKRLRVSPGLLRGFTCPPMCGGCCPKFSLDYLPEEEHPYELETREVEFSGRAVTVHSDLQRENKGLKCKNLRVEDGRCGIHGRQPFSCDFELIRTFTTESPDQPNRLSTQLFGRGWAMTTVTPKKGALCTITPVDDASIDDAVRKLRRLEQWMNHFGVASKIPLIYPWIEEQRGKPFEKMEPLFV